MRKKADLPTKTCPVCKKPFAWRKKWARDWDSVIYCSKRCSAAGESQTQPHNGSTPS
ncbi:MAG: DUF2256 domain-containing protein [Hyphomicrobiales bacterium]